MGGKWSPTLGTPGRTRERLSGTWLVLVGGFLAVGLLWLSLAYRFQISAIPSATGAALAVAGLHLAAAVLDLRRGRSAFLVSLGAVVGGIAAAILVRVYFLIGVEVVAGVLLLLGRVVLLSGHGRR
ncbi:MAG: hypothetical protein NZL87_07555 [Thermomicrobium sp.]|nr:hypothetical protein [Thermomicrobium sp.]